MKTNIYISRKLEKTVPKSFINNLKDSIENPLDKWNANLFYVSNKKCWIITNSISKYSVLLDRIKVADLTRLSEIFTKTFYQQLKTDDIETDLLTIQKLIGQINLFSTDNDQKIIGIQNSILTNLEDWKYEFGHIDNWPFRDINKRINRIPYKQIGMLSPKKKLNEIITKL